MLKHSRIAIRRNEAGKDGAGRMSMIDETSRSVKGAMKALKQRSR